jgi:hypothetical protein
MRGALLVVFAVPSSLVESGQGPFDNAHQKT